jgi:hypothetical protein
MPEARLASGKAAADSNEVSQGSARLVIASGDATSNGSEITIMSPAAGQQVRLIRGPAFGERRPALACQNLRTRPSEVACTQRPSSLNHKIRNFWRLRKHGQIVRGSVSGPTHRQGIGASLAGNVVMNEVRGSGVSSRTTREGQEHSYELPCGANRFRAGRQDEQMPIATCLCDRTVTVARSYCAPRGSPAKSWAGMLKCG